MSKRRRWSPLTCLTPAPLSSSGLILLDIEDSEVETFARTNVELRHNGSDPLPLLSEHGTVGSSSTESLLWNPNDVGLTIHITTHRIVMIDETIGYGGSVPFALVQTAHPTGGPTFLSPKSSFKIELSTHAWGHLIIVFRGGEHRSYTQSSKDREEAWNAIQGALKRKAWQNKERQVLREALRPSNAIAATKVGIDAILTRNELRHRENVDLADAAFSGRAQKSVKSSGVVGSLLLKGKNKESNDEAINNFLLEASELIKIVQKYTATIERERRITSNNKECIPSSGKNDSAELMGMLENMGMTSALSATQSGTMYHKLLARQLVDFLREKDKLKRAGGMMTLTDVYCLFNRARGTNMISPQDLLRALDIMKELKLGLSKRIFLSGVAVIQDDSFDDSIMAKTLTDFATSSMQPVSKKESVGGITSIDVSKFLKISALLANEHLLSAEQMGLLCSDNTIEGIRYFPNLFATGDFSLCQMESL